MTSSPIKLKLATNHSIGNSSPPCAPAVSRACKSVEPTPIAKSVPYATPKRQCPETRVDHSREGSPKIPHNANGQYDAKLDAVFAGSAIQLESTKSSSQKLILLVNCDRSSMVVSASSLVVFEGLPNAIIGNVKIAESTCIKNNVVIQPSNKGGPVHSFFPDRRRSRGMTTHCAA